MLRACFHTVGPAIARCHVEGKASSHCVDVDCINLQFARYLATECQRGLH